VAGVLFHALDTAKKVVNATQATVKHVEGEKMECWASMFGVAPPVHGGRMGVLQTSVRRDMIAVFGDTSDE
jgi:hypothetical protein